MSKHFPDGTNWVKFKEPQSGSGFTATGARIEYPFQLILSPEQFEEYRRDAQRVIRVLKGEPQGDDVEILPELGYNRMGLDNFLVALAYELLETQQ